MSAERAAADDRTPTSAEDLQKLLDELESERLEARERVLKGNQKLERIASER